MAGAGVYSTRFVMSSVPNSWIYYTVPSSSRAVVMTVVISNFSTAAAMGYAEIASYYPYAYSIPAGESRALTQMRIAAYGGERIGVLLTVPLMHGFVSGYVFDDPYGARAPDTERVPVVRPEQLPSG